eukprot:4019730-Pleurochrysis_carterae.AAC.2
MLVRTRFPQRPPCPSRATGRVPQLELQGKICVMDEDHMRTSLSAQKDCLGRAYFFTESSNHSISVLCKRAFAGQLRHKAVSSSPSPRCFCAERKQSRNGAQAGPRACA